MPFPTLRQRERGTGLAELVVASVLTVVTVTVGGFATSTLVQKGFHDFRYSAADSTHRALELALIRDSASAVAVFMPPTDTLGGQNCDANGNCHEIRIAVRSANHSTLTRIYRFDSSTNTVHVLESTVVSNANATDTGLSYTNIDKFSGLAVLASNASDPDLPGVSGTDVVAEMGSAQMIGGNGLVDVTIATDATERVVRLANSALDVADVTYNVIGTYYPPPPSFLTAGPNLVFSDSTQPPQTFSALENRYIGPFGVTACIDGLGRTLATITGGGDGPTETYSVTPVNRSGPAGDPGGVCTVIVTDDLGNSAPVQITVDPTRGALVVDPIIIQFSKPGNTNPIGTHPSGVTFADGSGVFTATEPYYTGTFSITAGDTSGNNACGGTITFSQIAGNQWSSSSNAQTACYVTVHDDGQRSPIAVSVNSYAAPVYAITPATQTLNTYVGQGVTFSATSTLQNPGNVAPGTPSTLSIALQNGNGPCSGWAPTSWSASGTSFSTTPSAAGQCAVNIVDTNSDTPAVVYVEATQESCPPGEVGTPPNCVEPTPSPPSGTDMYITVETNVNQSLPIPASAGHCSTSTGNICPFQLGTIPIDLSHVDQAAICYIGFDLMNDDNGGWPTTIFAGLSEVVTPVAVYNASTGFLYIPNTGGPAEVWSPPGYLVSTPTDLPGEDKYYIANLMPTLNPAHQYIWVALSGWQLPLGTPDAGPDPPSNTGGLSYSLGGGTPSECFGPLDGTIASVNVFI